MKLAVDKTGYSKVCLCKDGQRKSFLVHRLVGEAYIPNPQNLPEINHLSENKNDNSVTNLCWTTHIENMNYGTRTQRASKAIGEANSKAIKCIELNKVFNSQIEAAKELGLCSSSGISKCCKGERKTAGGYHFEFVGVDNYE